MNEKIALPVNMDKVAYEAIESLKEAAAKTDTNGEVVGYGILKPKEVAALLSHIEHLHDVVSQPVQQVDEDAADLAAAEQAVKETTKRVDFNELTVELGLGDVQEDAPPKHNLFEGIPGGANNLDYLAEKAILDAEYAALAERDAEIERLRRELYWIEAWIVEDAAKTQGISCADAAQRVRDALAKKQRGDWVHDGDSELIKPR